MKMLGSLFGNDRLRAAFFVSLVFAWTAGALFMFVPPPRPASAQFVEQSTYGGTSTGSANAQVISIPNLRGHTPGVVLRFIPGFTNTGPTTLNDGTGAVPIMRPSSIGPVALSGQELWAGELTCVSYNSAASAYQLGCNVDLRPIGDIVEFRGPTAPRGTLIEDGSCVSRTTYAPLFSVIGTTWGTCDGSTTFAVPDSRGEMIAALDNQGANGSANRITTAGSSCNATAVGGSCGSQNQTLTAAQLPANIPNSATTTSSSVLPPINATNGVAVPGTASAYIFQSGSVTYATTVTINPSGGATHPILNPISLARRAIKY